jgi:hypothetical protein
MQAFINQIEGRYRIDTCGDAAPGLIPAPMEAAGHLAERQAEREQAFAQSAAAIAAARAQAAAAATPPSYSSKRQLITDGLCALVVVALLSFVLSYGEPLRGW